MATFAADFSSLSLFSSAFAVAIPLPKPVAGKMSQPPETVSENVVLQLDGNSASFSSPPQHSRLPLSTTTTTQQLPQLPKQVPRTESDSKIPSRNSSSKSYCTIDVPSDAENETETLPLFPNPPQLSDSSDGAVLSRNPSIRRRIPSRRPSDKREDEKAEPVVAVAEAEGNVTGVEANSGVKELPLALISRIVKEGDFKSLRELGGAKGVASALGSNLDHGVALDSETSEWDTVGTVPLAKFFSYLWEACNSYTIILLLILAVLSFGTGMIEKGVRVGWYEGSAILVAVLALITFPAAAKLIRERKQARELLEKSKSLTYTVVRSGRSKEIPVSGLVAGDIVQLREGHCVPADGLFLDGNDFLVLVDNMSISGFSRETNPFLFSGAKVEKGSGRMLVTCVGEPTALSMPSHDPIEMKLLPAQMQKPNSYIDKLALVFSIVVAIVMLTRLLCKKQNDDIDHPEIKGEPSIEGLMKILKIIFVAPNGRISMLANSLAAVVIGFQHGMHLVACYSLIHWNKKVNKKVVPSKIQDLFACATMGLVSVICMDTTYGLFCEKPEIKHVWIGDADVFHDDKSEIAPDVLEALSRAFGHLELEPQDPIYGILRSWVQSRGNVAWETLKQNYVVWNWKGLVSKKDGVSSGIVMHKDGDDRNNLHLHWKGSASCILRMCSRYFKYGGETGALEDQRRTFEKVISDMEKKGLRTIAYAYSPMKSSEMREDGLILLAIVGVKYSCDDSIKPAVKDIWQSGVKIKLLSDHGISSIRAIACGLGLVVPRSDDETLDDQDLEEFISIVLTDEQDQRTVVKGIQCEENRRIVKKLKNDSVVAFVGRLPSDVLALKEADVGIAVDSHCTDMARENSDIIISEKISPIFEMLRLGRCAYNNVRLFTQLQLISCFSGLLLTLIVAVCTGISPVTPVQLVWVNLVTWILGGFMMTIELNFQEPGNGTQVQANRKGPFVTKSMWMDIGLHVLCALVVFLTFEYKGSHMFVSHMKDQFKRTMIFNAFTFCQVFNLLNAMKIWRKDPLVSTSGVYGFWLSLVAVIAAQVLVVEYLKNLANCVRLDALQWTACFVIAAVPFSLVRAIKFVYYSFWQFPLYIRLRSLTRRLSNRRSS